MERFPGYTTLRTEPCPEQHGTLTVLTHDVSGATVLLVENEDINKAFGIGFGTFPSDDTGVFHILEHSVLAGSEKYPVTSPFLQLLKSSMASFLNAMTFPDKTLYPVSSRNRQDPIGETDGRTIWQCVDHKSYYGCPGYKRCNSIPPFAFHRRFAYRWIWSGWNKWD